MKMTSPNENHVQFSISHFNVNLFNHLNVNLFDSGSFAIINIQNIFQQIINLPILSKYVRTNEIDNRLRIYLI